MDYRTAKVWILIRKYPKFCAVDFVPKMRLNLHGCQTMSVIYFVSSSKEIHLIKKMRNKKLFSTLWNYEGPHFSEDFTDEWPTLTLTMGMS